VPPVPPGGRTRHPRLCPDSIFLVIHLPPLWPLTPVGRDSCGSGFSAADSGYETHLCSLVSFVYRIVRLRRISARDRVPHNVSIATCSAAVP
jgi:hypothetical protein